MYSIVQKEERYMVSEGQKTSVVALGLTNGQSIMYWNDRAKFP